MSMASKHLKVKTSIIPNAGKGLFVTVDVPKGTIITEYLGQRTHWAAVENDVDNSYIYYIDDENVINGATSTQSFGRYANDAAGLTKVPGLKNNAEYYEHENRVFIKAKTHLPAGSEVLVSYGRDYWKQVRQNIKIEAAQSKAQ